jgi:hypothetical protein
MYRHLLRTLFTTCIRARQQSPNGAQYAARNTSLARSRVFDLCFVGRPPKALSPMTYRRRNRATRPRQLRATEHPGQDKRHRDTVSPSVERAVWSRPPGGAPSYAGTDFIVVRDGRNAASSFSTSYPERDRPKLQRGTPITLRVRNLRLKSSCHIS